MEALEEAVLEDTDTPVELKLRNLSKLMREQQEKAKLLSLTVTVIVCNILEKVVQVRWM